MAATTTVTITASYNGTTRTGTLTVTTPAGDPPPATLQSMSVSPSTRRPAASGVQGRVSALGPRQQAARTVSLSSSNPAWRSVPASVTVAGGASTFTFPISTSAVEHVDDGHDLRDLRRRDHDLDADGTPRATTAADATLTVTSPGGAASA